MIAPTTTKNRVVIVDGNNLAYAAFYAFRKFNHETSRYFMTAYGTKIYRLSKKSVGTIFGFPQILKKVITDLEPNDLIVVWDGRIHKDRVRLNPDYKSHRKKRVNHDPKNFRYQRKAVMRLLNYLGVKQVHHPEMEADDFIYMLSEKYRHDENNEVVIVSRDKDFFQLIKKNVYIWDTNQVHVTGFTTKKTLKNPKLFHGEIPSNYGYYPKQTVDYLALVGDKSDDIVGYPGIGPKKALGFLEEHSSIKEFLQSDESYSIIDKKKLAKLWKLNRLLISLPLYVKKFIEGKIDITYYREDSNPSFNSKKLRKFCDKYNIKTFRMRGFKRTYKSIK